MKLLPLFAASALALGITSTHAETINYNETFSYNYAQLGYSFINDFPVDQGVIISGSHDVTNNINVVGSYFISTSADSNKDVDINVYTLGVGYHTDIADSTGVLAEIGLFNSDSNAKIGKTSIDQDDSGYTLAVGLRHKLSDKVELLTRFDHRNGDSLTDNSFTFGGRYFFKPNWSAGLGFNTGADDGAESITGNLRWEF